ncbi:MAG TPA: hypothetical protein VKA89_00665 [Solirubrobacterales bacterium]|nr:hypothetical protein [Solirubrobacterales bacterium]
MRFLRVAVAAAFSAAAVVLPAGCGGSDGDGSGGSTVADRPAPPASEFPSAKGKTLGQVLETADGSAEEAGIVVSPASMVFEKGQNRYGFGVFSTGREQMTDAEVALYFARVPPSESTVIPKGGAKEGESGSAQPPPENLASALDQKATGPFPAAVESLETEPAFRAKTTTDDPDAALAVYTTTIDFPANGEWRVAALVNDGGETRATLLPSAVVGQFGQVPQVGDRPPRVHTPTAEEVGGDLASIDTRLPPSTQHEQDFADVLGKKPIVLLFATPQFCQSRVCGPVVDVTEQLKEEYGDEVTFIHMEIFNDNDPNKGARPQVRAFHLPSEPWVFVIDRAGVIRTAIEGAFGVNELDEAIQGVTG